MHDISGLFSVTPWQTFVEFCDLMHGGAALVAALHDKRTAGTALDVFDGGQQVQAEPMAIENVVLTPHIASTPTRHRTMGNLVYDNLRAHLDGKQVLSPVPLQV